MCTKFIAFLELGRLIRKAQQDRMRKKEGECVQDIVTRFTAMHRFLESAEELQISHFVSKLLPDIKGRVRHLLSQTGNRPKASRCK